MLVYQRVPFPYQPNQAKQDSKGSMIWERLQYLVFLGAQLVQTFHEASPFRLQKSNSPILISFIQL